MLIGIDMLGVQSPAGAGRQPGRFGRQLVAAMLARDPAARFLLYAHEGLPVGSVPSARNATRVPLAPVAGRAHPRRAAVQRLLDRDPDGLDWLVLLDPFEPDYGGLPPEAPLGGPRVASVVHGLAQALGDERRLAPIRRHDAILATSEAAAEEYRKRLGMASSRVASIGLAPGPSTATDGPPGPLTRASADELGRLGIRGPFLLAGSTGGTSRAELAAILEGYRRLPVECRRGHQLAIAGPVADPAAARGVLRDGGADDGLVLTGDLPESTLGALLGRCSAYLAPSPEGGSGLATLEAMGAGAPVIAGRSPATLEIVEDAGLLVEPSDPAALASAIGGLLADPDLGRELRRRSLARSARASIESVAGAALDALGGRAPRALSRSRVDRPHRVRPRIAVFPDPSRRDGDTPDPADGLSEALRDAYAIDLYLEPGDPATVDALPPEYGGFDARLFGRNDAILGYHAVVYRVDRADGLDGLLGRLRARPGLVLLRDDAWLDGVGPGDDAGEAAGRLREVFRTGSRVVVSSPRHFDRVGACLPEFVGQLVDVPPARAPGDPPEGRRSRARARLGLPPEALVIGQFGGPGGTLSPRAFRAVAREVPGLVLLSFDSGPEAADVRREVEALGIGDRFLPLGPASSAELREVVTLLDLAIHGGGPGPMALLDLLKHGIPSIAHDREFPDAVTRDVVPSRNGGELARAVRDLASDPETRASLGRSASAYCVGTPDPALASALLLDEIDRSGHAVPRGEGRPRRPAEGPRGLGSPPHFPRPAPVPGDPATPSR